MQKNLIDVIRAILPIGPRKRKFLERMREYIPKDGYDDIHYLLKLGKLGFTEKRFGTSRSFPDTSWPEIIAATDDKRVLRTIEIANTKIEDAVKLETFSHFKKIALDKITLLISPNIVGMDAVKRAAALQLFSQEPFHILLLGDPGTGKTDILRSIERLAPHTAFGLGSGASKAGLVGSYEGKEFHPGLLMQADEGFALIDELNLLQKADRAGLYSAMEKGFVKYDKKGKHEKFDTRIRVLATANPKGDKFIGKDVRMLKTQVPFDDALLSRFHLLFLIRKPSSRELEQITRKIVKQDVREIADGDADFVQEYIAYAEKLNVTFDDKYESMIVDFIEEMKRQEDYFIVEVGPRLVIGVIRIAKAFARSRLSRNTNADDVENALKLVKSALII